MEMWAQLKKFSDGEDLNAETLNVPIGQLGDRTSYLYSKLRGLGDAGNLSAVVLTDVALSTEEGKEPVVGNAVYLDNATNTFAAARATMSLVDDFTAADSAFTVGILQYRDGNSPKGNVLLYGNLTMNPDSAPVMAANMIATGETFRKGKYFLSATEPGRLTAHPTGPWIYVCTILGEVAPSGSLSGNAIVSPQFLDIGTSHVHRTAVLVARPAGEVDSTRTNVLGYPTLAPGPYHLIFGGTWTGPNAGVSYQFKLGVNQLNRRYMLMWNEGDEIDSVEAGTYSHSADFSDDNKAEVSNGIVATLTVDANESAQSDDQKTWDTLKFPYAAQGWVNHVAYDGDPYPDAKYDYVLGMDQYVSNYWPPVPAKSAALLVNGVEMDNYALVPNAPTVAFGRDTIHWFSNNKGLKPWPQEATDRDSEVNPAYDKVEVLHWVRGFQGSTGPVTSIQPRKGSPLKIYGYGSDKVANTGDLEIDAELDFTLENGGLQGYLVPKDSKGGRMLLGPVVERIVAGSGITVMSKAGCPNGQGTVVIGLDNGSYRNRFSDIALENAEQAKIGMFPYIRLKGYSGNLTSPSSFTAMMRVPDNMPDTTYALRLSLSMFGENGFSDSAVRNACFKLSYNILPDLTAPTSEKYSSLKNNLLVPDSERTVVVPLGHSDGEGGIVYIGFDPVQVVTDDPDEEDVADVIEKKLGPNVPSTLEFQQQPNVTPELRPGYMVGIRISRAKSSTGIDYSGPLGFVNMTWELVPTVSEQVQSRTSSTGVYVPDHETGLYHEVVAVSNRETGEVDLGIEQQGIEK